MAFAAVVLIVALATYALYRLGDPRARKATTAPARKPGHWVTCPFCDWATPNDLNVVEQMSAHTADRHLTTNHLTGGTTE